MLSWQRQANVTHDFLLRQVLRKEWGYKGIVMPDWGSGAPISDLLRVGNDHGVLKPPKGQELMTIIRAGLDDGSITQAMIDERYRSRHRYQMALGLDSRPKLAVEDVVMCAEHTAIALRGAARKKASSYCATSAMSCRLTRA